jgi:hypothetical protein
LAIDDEPARVCWMRCASRPGSPIDNDHCDVPTSGGVFASHQKRRRCPCDHRGSSTVDAAVCELRIEPLATVLVCSRALGILPHFRFPLMESALGACSSRCPEQARRLGQCCSEREEDGPWDVASEALDEAAAGVPHRETDVVADDGGEERENFRRG